MTRIMLVRHGETEWNKTEIFRGRADIELSETGIKQAELLAEYLRNISIDAIYSSPLKRATQTAEMIASYHKLNIEISPDLTDLDFGEWQELSLKQVQQGYPELYSEWTNHPDRLKIPNGESLKDVWQRAIRLVDRIITWHNGTVIIVAHRVVNKVLICALLGIDNSHFWNIRQDNCGVTAFDYENERFTLTEHNNTSFLAPLQKAALSDF